MTCELVGVAALMEEQGLDLRELLGHGDRLVWDRRMRYFRDSAPVCGRVSWFCGVVGPSSPGTTAPFSSSPRGSIPSLTLPNRLTPSLPLGRSALARVRA